MDLSEKISITILLIAFILMFFGFVSNICRFSKPEDFFVKTAGYVAVVWCVHGFYIFFAWIWGW